MGGEGRALFTCSGCSIREVCLPCSNTYKETNQSVVSVALHFFAQEQTMLNIIAF